MKLLLEVEVPQLDSLSTLVQTLPPKATGSYKYVVLALAIRPELLGLKQTDICKELGMSERTYCRTLKQMKQNNYDPGFYKGWVKGRKACCDE